MRQNLGNETKHKKKIASLFEDLTSCEEGGLFTFLKDLPHLSVRIVSSFVQITTSPALKEDNARTTIVGGPETKG